MPIVPQRFSENSHEELYQFSGQQYGRRHAAVLLDRMELTMPEAIALALELPTATWIGGGFAAAYINGLRPSRLDLFFGGESSFLETVKRLQNAPEGSYMHGYVQVESVVDMIGNQRSVLTFTHSSKPTINLVRTRWYGNAPYLVDTFDLVVDQVLLGSDLFFTHAATALQDAQAKLLKVHKTLFHPNLGFDCEEYVAKGYRLVGNERYNTNIFNDAKRWVIDWHRSRGTSANPKPIAPPYSTL